MAMPYWRLPRAPLVHLITADAWAAAQEQRLISSPSLEHEGFVHLSTTWQAPGSAARHYAGRTDLVALAIDPSGLRPGALRWDESYPGQYFPHHYEPIPVAAVIAAVPWCAPPAAGEGDPWVLPVAFPAPPVAGPLADGVRLRRLGPDDAAEVGVLIEAAIVGRDGAPTNVDNVAARGADRLATFGGWGIGAVDLDDRLVSVVLGVPMLADHGAGPPVPGWCHLGTVMTHPDRWGHGLATRLMVEAVVVMRVNGDHHAELWTQVGNERARRMYERLDWERSDVPESEFEGERLVHYTLELRP